MKSDEQFIAEEAYRVYLYRMKTGKPGDEISDWLIAEQRIMVEDPKKYGGSFYMATEEDRTTGYLARYRHAREFCHG